MPDELFREALDELTSQIGLLRKAIEGDPKEGTKGLRAQFLTEKRRTRWIAFGFALVFFLGIVYVWNDHNDRINTRATTRCAIRDEARRQHKTDAAKTHRDDRLLISFLETNLDAKAQPVVHALDLALKSSERVDEASFLSAERDLARALPADCG